MKKLRLILTVEPVKLDRAISMYGARAAFEMLGDAAIQALMNGRIDHRESTIFVAFDVEHRVETFEEADTNG